MFSPARHRLAANLSGIEVRSSGSPGASPTSTTPPVIVSASPSPAPAAAAGQAGMSWFWPLLVLGVGGFVAYDYSKGNLSPART